MPTQPRTVLYTLFALAVIASLGSSAFADPPSLEIEGAIRSDILFRRQDSGKIQDDMNSSETYLRLSSDLSRFVRVAVAFELDRDLRENGRWTEQSKLSIEELLREASIEIHDVGGVPVAFVIGKQEIAFGQAVTAMPAFTRGALYETQTINRVLGLTVRLDKTVLGIIQSIEASAFSSETDSRLSHGSIGKIDSASVRVKGEIFEGLQFSVSAAHLGNKHLGSDSTEQRYSVGLIYTDPKGVWKTWIEGLYHADKNNPRYGENAHFGITAGALRRAGPGDVVAEVSWIQNVMTEVGIGYRLLVTPNVTVGPEVRLIRWQNTGSESRNDLRVGIVLEILLGGATLSPEDEVLFGAKKERQK